MDCNTVTCFSLNQKKVEEVQRKLLALTEARKKFLFASMPDRSLADRWEDKFEFWRDITNSLLKDQLAVSYREIGRALECNGVQPLCLSDILQELKRREIIVSEEDVKNGRIPAKQYFQWIKRYAVSFFWSESKVGPKDILILLSNMEERAENLLQVVSSRAPDYCDLLVLHEELDGMAVDETKGMCTRQELDLVLFFLKARGLGSFVRAETEARHPVLGFKFTSVREPQLKFDETWLSLQRSAKRMCDTVEQYQSRIEKIRMECIKHMSTKNRPLALICLKRKKTVENELQTKLTLLNNIEEMILALKQSLQSREMVRIMMEANHVLKSFTSSTCDGSSSSLLDEADKIRDEFMEAKEELDMVSDALVPADSLSVLEDADLETELQELMKEPATDRVSESEKPGDEGQPEMVVPPSSPSERNKEELLRAAPDTRHLPSLDEDFEELLRQFSPKISLVE